MNAQGSRAGLETRQLDYVYRNSLPGMHVPDNVYRK